MSINATSLSPEYRFTPAPAFPRYSTSALNRLSDRFWETRFNINTRGGAPSPHSDAHHYGYLAYHTYFSVFDRLRLKPSDVVVDLGCGKGRVSCIAASYRIRASVGVEIDPPLAELAQVNATRMRGRRAPLRIECVSATDFDYDETNVIVMFHPFGPDTMRTVMSRWQHSLARRPREFRVVYGNPILSPMLAAKPWLELYECWNPGTWSRVKFPIHFYRSVPGT
jgi:SAM-dependent methyltransferase